MVVLILGLALLIAPHLWQRLALPAGEKPSKQAAMIAGVIKGVALIVIILGYRQAEGTVYWGRSPALVGLNNLLMLIAVYCFAAAGMKTRLARKIRWPMAWGIVIWAFAHLLVNGDTPSFVLFGGLLAWVLVQIALMQAKSAPWVLPAPRPAKMELFAILGTLAVYGLIGALHGLLGYPAFG